MEQIKLKTFTAETLELLEKNINAFLSSEEATNLKLVNITIKEIEERTFPNNEEEFNESSPDSCVKCYTMFLPFLLIKIDVFS